MAMWSIFAAPLLMSNDLRDLPRDAKEVLLNKEVHKARGHLTAPLSTLQHSIHMALLCSQLLLWPGLIMLRMWIE